MVDSVKIECQEKIHTLFKTMDLVEALDSDKLVLSWLEKHKSFYGFVDGQWMTKEDVEKVLSSTDNVITCHEICDIFTKKYLCDVHTTVDKNLVEWCIKSSERSSSKWGCSKTESKSKILYNIAKNIEKYQLLFSMVEAISSGKHLNKVKTKDIPNLIESFKYYASWALKLNAAEMHETWVPIGPVCVIAEKYNNPSLTLSLRVSSLLAAGNSVVLLTDAHCSLSAFLLAEICFSSGLPPGVLNVIPIDQKKFKTLEDFPACSRLIFTGSFENSAAYSKLCDKAMIHFETLIPRRPVVIVYEDVDLHAAAHGVIEAFIYHDTRSESGGCKVMIQESIIQKFLDILVTELSSLLVGNNLTKSDLSGIVLEDQEKFLTECIEAVKLNAKVAVGSKVCKKGCNYIRMMPTLLSDLQTSSKLVHNEFGGPIIVTVPFRTVKESISMFNCDNKGSPVTIWTQIIGIALEVSQKLKSGVIYVNSENMTDTRFPFSGIYLSGNSVEGGKDGIFSHMNIAPENFEARDEIVMNQCDEQECSKMEKLFGNILNSGATEGDVLTAVTKAVSAQSKWDSFSSSQKCKILIDVMGKLEKSKEEFVAEIQKTSGCSLDDCKNEVDHTLDVLYYWAMKNDKYNEPAKEITKNLMAFENREALGVIGIQCSDKRPLFSFISLVVPAILYGNAVVSIVSMKYRTLALKMSEIFSSTNVPTGVINAVVGSPSVLIPPLRKNTDVNSVWCTDVSYNLVFDNCNPIQRLFYCRDNWCGMSEARAMKFALESTYSKSVFLPFGEIFAN